MHSLLHTDNIFRSNISKMVIFLFFESVNLAISCVEITSWMSVKNYVAKNMGTETLSVSEVRWGEVAEVAEVTEVTEVTEWVEWASEWLFLAASPLLLSLFVSFSAFKFFTCAGQLIVRTVILVVKLPFMVVTRSLF